MEANDLTASNEPASGPRSPWKTRYFLDTEFTDFTDSQCDFKHGQLISVGIVGEDGCEFYGELLDYDRAACNDFVCHVVLPQLGQHPGRAMPFAQLRSELLAWLYRVPKKPKPVLSYDYEGDIDLILDLIGGKLPPGWKHENVFQRIDGERLETYFREHGGRHHALHDARANRYAFV
ncbi:hypothetical protein J4G52_24345 [Burkholderia cenocepacia]|uniref:hypothetical protein n=1 Tax=Burkholderia cenocepacia TaxID=95486 RepID=UPI001AA11A37|nr:hypothetical protein [Burkholderia cenocepacia]MBO1856672.1 hypothetical protein [Burkholderia cenocepacia]